MEEITTTKHIPGDTTAQIFWLKNRKPEYWGGGHEFAGVDETTVEIYLPDNERDGKNERKE